MVYIAERRQKDARGMAYSVGLRLYLRLELHGPSIFAVKARIYGVIYKQSSSIAFDETSSYWLQPNTSSFLGFSLVATRQSGFHWPEFRHHEGSTFTEKDRNKLNYRIGPKWT